MPKEKKFRGDVTGLVRASTIEEAAADVFARLETAMEALDPASRELLQEHFEGTTVEELGRRCGLGSEEIQLWLKRAKLELVKNLRQNCQVRQ